MQKLAHTNVRAIKSTIGYSERSSILTASEKHPPYKIFDYSVKIHFAWYHTPLKNFMDNPPTHKEKEKHSSPCLFSHNKGMNTMICVLQPLFPPLLSSTRPQVYSKVRLPAERVSYGHVILRTRLTRAFVRSPNWRQDSGWRTCCICRVRSAYVYQDTKLICENDGCLVKFAGEVIVARQAALWVHYLK